MAIKARGTGSPGTDPVDTLVHIRSEYGRLRDSERKVADFILEDPRRILALNINQIGQGSGVSVASVIRLCKALGYIGYQQLKVELSRSLIEPVKSIHEEAEEGDLIGNLARKVFLADIQALQDTLSNMDSESVAKAAEILSGASRIEFYGLGGSGAVAADAHHKFFRLGIPCIAYSDNHMQLMSAALLGPGDVAVGISHSGSTKDIIDAMTTAGKSGATTICITSSPGSPITSACDVSLLVTARELAFRPEPMAARICQLAVLDMLSVAVALRRESIVVANLGKSRAALSSRRY